MSPVASVESVGPRVYPANPYSEFLRSEVEQSIAARFEKQVAQYGGRVAVRTKRHELSYDKLNRLANRLARAIGKADTTQPVAVALLFDHDAPLIAAILAVLKAGRFYVVLESSHPVERLRAILDDSGADLLITESKHLHLAEEIAAPGCLLLNSETLEASIPDDNLNLATSPSALAYIVYTSGSTGRPKGVCQTQRNVLHHTRKYTNGCHLCAEDRFSLLALCSFSASVSNLFGALLNGAALLPFSVKEEGIANLIAWLQKEEISIYHSVPLVFRNLARAVTEAARFPKLRLIKLGGESITRSDFDLFKQHFDEHALFYVGLGASEMNCIRYWLLDRASDFSGPIAPVGYAVEDTEVLLLDENQKEVPFGEAGEIAVRSSYLFPGYWKRPELTEAAFLPPSPGSSHRIFRTGDVGRMLPRGLLLHLGRNESQIKIRGARIEPAEIEFVLRSQPEVTNCVVLAKDNAADKHLVAFLTNGSGPKPDTPTLRARLAGKLPDYMVPTSFIWLEEMPLLNGKIDRKALLKLGDAISDPTRQYVAPRNQLETQLVNIMQTVLRQDRIGVSNNFFELGGDSLAAALVAVEIDKLLGGKLPLSTLFWSPTVESLAQHLTEGDSAPPLPSLVSLQPAGSKPPLFIVHGWGGDVHFFGELARLLPDQPVYGLQAVGLDGRVPRHITIEEMAAHYVQEVRAFQPDGPYRLVGYSLGSLIAFEMGRQFDQAGQSVAFLGLLDPPLRPAPWFVYAQTIAPFLWRNGRFHVQRWVRTAGRESVHLKRRWKNLRRWIDKNRPTSRVVLSPPECSSTPPEIPGFRDYYSAVASAYRLRRYAGFIDLIASDTQTPILLPLWKRMAKTGAKIHRISCTHRQMIEREYLPALANTILEAMARTDHSPPQP